MKKMKTILFAGFGVCMSVCTTTLQAANTGIPAPDFTLPTLQNETPVSLKQFAGKVVYLDFWASWCAPCRTSFPLLDALYKQYGPDGFAVLAINLDEDSKDAKRFLADYPVSFTILRNADGRWADAYGVQAMPTSFILDRSGMIRWAHQGFSKSDLPELEAKIVQLLKSEQP